MPGMPVGLLLVMKMRQVYLGCCFFVCLPFGCSACFCLCYVSALGDISKVLFWEELVVNGMDGMDDQEDSMLLDSLEDQVPPPLEPLVMEPPANDGAERDFDSQVLEAPVEESWSSPNDPANFDTLPFNIGQAVCEWPVEDSQVYSPSPVREELATPEEAARSQDRLPDQLDQRIIFLQCLGCNFWCLILQSPTCLCSLTTCLGHQFIIIKLRQQLEACSKSSSQVLLQRYA